MPKAFGIFLLVMELRSIAEIFRTPDLVWGSDFLLFSFLTQDDIINTYDSIRSNHS